MTPEGYDAKAAFAALLPTAIVKLGEWLNNDKDADKQKFALQTVLDRNLGKAVERKEVTGANGGAIQIEDQTPSIRILLQAALPEPEKVIDVEERDPD